MSCRICESNNTRFLFCSKNTHGRFLLENEEEFMIFECLDCGLIFLSGIEIDGEYHNKYYKKGYYNEKLKKNNNFLDIFAKKIFNQSLKVKQKIISKELGLEKKVSILDIGCGSGNFLAQLDSEKFDKNGIEINKEGFDSSKKKGINVFNRDIADIDFAGKKFDVISFWHVLEHIHDPIELFRNIKKNINDNGVLIFQVPNTESFGFKYGKQNWFHLDSPRHLMLYNEKSIQKLCELVGFKIVSVSNEFYDYPLDLFWSIRKSNLKFIIYPLYPIFKFFSREHLTFVCKKK